MISEMRWKLILGLPLYSPCAVPMAGAKTIDAGLANERHGLIQGHHRPAVLVADAIFDTLDGFQFTFHRHAVLMR
jgi:hypothetical protein